MKTWGVILNKTSKLISQLWSPSMEPLSRNQFDVYVFGCLRVKTATVLISIWHMIAHAFALEMFAEAYTESWQKCKVLWEAALVGDMHGKPFCHEIVTSAPMISYLFMTFFSYVANCLMILGLIVKGPYQIFPFLILQCFDLTFSFIMLGVNFINSIDLDEFYMKIISQPLRDFFFMTPDWMKYSLTFAYLFSTFVTKCYLVCVVCLCFFYMVEERRLQNMDNMKRRLTITAETSESGSETAPAAVQASVV